MTSAPPSRLDQAAGEYLLVPVLRLSGPITACSAGKHSRLHSLYGPPELRTRAEPLLSKTKTVVR